MTEPSDDEMERAERIRKLRSGGARSRGHEMRERRREMGDDDGGGPPPSGGAEGGTGDDAADESAEQDGGDDAAPEGDDEDAAAEGDEAEDTLAAAGGADVVELAAGLPEDGSLFVVPVHEQVRREFTKVAEQLHLRYGFAYEAELDEQRHVRPLALYLGVQTLADADVEVVREVLEGVDGLAAPGEE